MRANLLGGLGPNLSDFSESPLITKEKWSDLQSAGRMRFCVVNRSGTRSPDIPHVVAFPSRSVPSCSRTGAREKTKNEAGFRDFQKVRPAPGGEPAAREPDLGTGRAGT